MRDVDHLEAPFDLGLEVDVTEVMYFAGGEHIPQCHVLLRILGEHVTSVVENMVLPDTSTTYRGNFRSRDGILQSLLVHSHFICYFGVKLVYRLVHKLVYGMAHGLAYWLVLV